MDKITLTAGDVCAIIKQCAESGVSELGLGDLTIRMGRVWPRAEDFVQTDTQVSPEMAARQEAVAVESLEREELVQRRDELAHTLIEDPVKFEELLTSGDLIDSTVGDEPNGEEDDHGSEPSRDGS